MTIWNTSCTVRCGFKIRTVTAPTQSVALDMISAAPRCPPPGDRWSPKTFSSRLNREMEASTSAEETKKSGEAATEAKTEGKPRPAPETEKAPRSRKVEQTSDGLAVAMAAAPVQVAPIVQTPVPDLTGSLPSPKPDRAAASDEVTLNRTSVLPMQEPVLREAALVGRDDVSQSLSPSLVSRKVAQEPFSIAERKTGKDRAEDLAAENRASKTDATPTVVPPPSIPDCGIFLDLPQRSPLRYVPSTDLLPSVATGRHVLSAIGAESAPAAKSPRDWAPQEHAQSPGLAVTDPNTITDRGADPTANQAQPALAHLQMVPDAHRPNSDDGMQSSSASPGQEPKAKVSVSEKQNAVASAPIPSAHSHGGEVSSSENNATSKAPPHPEDSVPAVVVAAVPRVGAQIAKPLAAESDGGGPGVFGQTPPPTSNPQTASASARSDSLRSGEVNPASSPPDVALLHAARLVQNGNDSEMRIGLRTENFGAVQVHTTVSEKQVEVALGSERGDLHGLVASDLPSLQTSLQQHDLRLQHVRTLEQSSLEQNFFGHSSGSRQQQHFARPDSKFAEEHERGEAAENEAFPARRSLSIRA